MTINVVISRSGQKTSSRMVSEFTRKVQSTGIVRGMRDRRYYAKPHTKLSRKNNAIKRITKRAETNQLIKEGKMVARVARTFKTAPSSTTSQSTQVAQ